MLICTIFLARVTDAETRIFFGPAIGTATCGVVGYLAVRLHAPSLITMFAVLSLGGGAAYLWKTKPLTVDIQPASRLVLFTLFALLALYGMQIALYGVFSRSYPGPHAVWSVFNMTGVSPPDQMFAWHQAMFLDQHRHYPQQPFYGEIDLYDRPHLGGWITLFFFKLFHLPLREHEFAYPAAALRFYHCLWWLLNNLYLFGVAPLFRRFFGFRGAIFAVASTSLGGFFLLCNLGAWMKFASAYPFLLALLLFSEGRAPVLQALLCATSYYIHGSVLPFLAGFGVLQILTSRYPIAAQRTSLRHAALFSCVGAIVVGAWFLLVRWVGSKQPLLYYYIYDAGLTEAQTRPVVDLAREFYARFTWRELSLQPLNNLWKSFFPDALYDFLRAWFWYNGAGRPSDFASTIFSSQRFCLECALSVLAAPLVIAGAVKALAHKHAGKLALCLYLIPTLMIALIYRKEWAFSLHVISLYHTLMLFCWLTFFRHARTPFMLAALSAVAIEGVVCVLFADGRFLLVTGLHLNELQPAQWPWLLVYLSLVICLVAGTARELSRSAAQNEHGVVPDLILPIRTVLATAGLRIATGAAITAAVVGVYAIYCRRFY